MESIRPIEPKDNTTMAGIIRQVMTEFGASGKGFAIHDPEVDRMYESYQLKGCRYYVVEENGKVLGGGGVAPLKGEDRICEIQKMYFLPEIRGKGCGAKMLQQCLLAAKTLGYDRCYIETLNSMVSARALYEKNGFQKIEGPMGQTGHYSCDSWYVKSLNS